MLLVGCIVRCIPLVGVRAQSNLQLRTTWTANTRTVVYQ
jgi:hypothetical protein